MMVQPITLLFLVNSQILIDEAEQAELIEATTIIIEEDASQNDSLCKMLEQQFAAGNKIVVTEVGLLVANSVLRDRLFCIFRFKN